MTEYSVTNKELATLRELLRQKNLSDPSLKEKVATLPDKKFPFDARFPHQNQLASCTVNFRDYHRCKRIKGDDYVNCNYFKHLYESYCPSFYLESLNKQMEDDTLNMKL